jgi:hypothetical protein
VTTAQTKAEEQQAAQIALIALMLKDFAKIWHLLTPSELDRSLPAWVTAIHAIVARYGSMSAALAADHYEEARLAAKARGQFTVQLPGDPAEGLVDTGMRWATRDVWSRDPETLPDRVKSARTMAENVAIKEVIDMARITTVDAVHEDPEAVGWARIARPNACYFCRMLTTRGGVYTAETVKFRAHNGCHCTAEPVFRGQLWEPSARVREWNAQYQRASKMKGDTLKNLRRIVEGRETPAT